MLQCRWEGGTPPATLRWWDGRGRALGAPAPSATVLVLSTDTSLRGRDFVCVAAHPLRAAGAECRLRLGEGERPRVPLPPPLCHGGRWHAASSPSHRADVPELEVERGEVAVLEGGEARLACRQRSGGELGAEMGWYDPQEREVPAGTTKYRLERGGPWANLTVRDAEWPQDGGTYRCAAANSVGTASLPVRLRVDRESRGWRRTSPWRAGGASRPTERRLAAGYPAPPNVTISKLRYTRARTEVRLQWRTEGAGNLTGFVVQRRPAKKPQRRVPGPWETAAGDIEPHSRDRRLGGLDPRVVYAFRVLAVNHRTAGHPSEVQTPGEAGTGQHAVLLRHPGRCRASVGATERPGADCLLAERAVSGERQDCAPARAAISRFQIKQAQAPTFLLRLCQGCPVLPSLPSPPVPPHHPGCSSPPHLPHPTGLMCTTLFQLSHPSRRSRP